jgi:1-acyl-sn-glycerol-3-phosphate acyltransferase
MNLSYLINWIVLGTFFRTYCRSRYLNVERVPLTGGAILASNHASFMDPPLVASGVWRQMNFLARDTLFTVPVVGSILRSWEVVPVDREGGGPGGLKGIMDRLERGRAVVLFPEGTRTRDGQIGKARSGIGLVVIKSTAPVIPVRLFGTREAFGRGAKFIKPHRVQVKFGSPINFAALRAEAKVCSKERLRRIYQQVADELMFTIGRLEPCVDKATFP